MIHLDHLAADRKDSGRLLNSTDQFFHVMRIGSRVIIQKDDIGGPGMPDSHIHCFAESIVPVKGNDLGFGVMFLHVCSASVRGCIVYDQDLKILKCLLFQGCKTGIHEVASIIIRDNYRNFHICRSAFPGMKSIVL